MLQFDRTVLPESCRPLREEVRDFLAGARAYLHSPNSDFASGYDPEFSKELGRRGWIGMTWPKKYGGGERSFLERYVVTEELLAAGAPVGAHWIADRQSGNLILRFGTEAQREAYLPAICRGECFFSIGMSEPGAGSDLAAVRATASWTDDGWLLNGTKLWSTHAHRNHYMVVLVRTEPPTDDRHAGLSQIVVDLRRDGAQVRPIRNMAGLQEFNEVVFENVLVPADRLLGDRGNGWRQVTSELAYERSGPERFLSSFRVFVEFVRAVGNSPTLLQAVTIGRLTAHLLALRRLSLSVAGMLEHGKSPEVEAALVKSLGNDFEKRLPELVRSSLVDEADASKDLRMSRLWSTLAETMLLSPAFTLRGGSREILRGVIARGLGLR